MFGRASSGVGAGAITKPLLNMNEALSCNIAGPRSGGTTPSAKVMLGSNWARVGLRTIITATIEAG